MAVVPNVGDVVAGKYRVERVLGQGGMGVVVAALHLHLHERVALKMILREVATPETIARFLREGRAAVKIKSEHVARVLDVGLLDDGIPFMVMEYLDGSDLGDVVARGPVPRSTAVGYLLQACEALAEAHALGIVHRDLKPANLFLTKRADGSPCVKVLDFGISKAPIGATPDGAMTKTADGMGSPCYMAPEQWHSARDVDVRADVWALGTILHELITGELPFDGSSVPALLASITRDAPVPLRSRRSHEPPALEAAILRCLEKDPARRFADIAELAAAIVEFGPPEARTSLDRITRVVRPARISDPALVTQPAYAHGPPSGPSRSSSGSVGERWSVAAVVATARVDSATNQPVAREVSARTARSRGGIVALVVVGLLAVALVSVGFGLRRASERRAAAAAAAESAAKSASAASAAKSASAPTAPSAASAEPPAGPSSSGPPLAVGSPPDDVPPATGASHAPAKIAPPARSHAPRGTKPPAPATTLTPDRE